jgi:hypothetical protein
VKFLIIISFISVFGTCNKTIPTVRLDGSKSFSETNIVSYRWYQVAGPTTIIFDNTNGAIVNVTTNKPAIGTYIIALEVTDNNGLKETGTATITVIK